LSQQHYFEGKLKKMRKIFGKICGVLLLLVLAAGLAACGEDEQSEDLRAGQQEGQNGEQGEQDDGERQFTLAELGATIEASGVFWNSWYSSHHTFNWSHIDDSRRNWNPDDENVAPLHHPLSRGFAVVLPTSGFAGLNDIATHLLQFYTQAWVDLRVEVGQLAETHVSMRVAPDEYPVVYGFYGFEEYDGELFVFIQYEWSARPDWQRAVHTLIEQDGNRAVVETVVPLAVGDHTPDYEMPTVTYRFTMIDGRIDSGFGSVNFPETAQDSHDSSVWQGQEQERAYGARLEIAHMEIFAYRAEELDHNNFDTLIEMGHPMLDGVDMLGDNILIHATRTMYNVSLIVLENDWDEDAGQITFSVANSFRIAVTLAPADAVLITGYVSLGILPWSGIMFDDAFGQQHFVAINHDNSDSPNWFVLQDITEQITQ